MKILVVFATTEGQTRKISKFAASMAGDLGHDVTVVESATPSRRLNAGAFDAVIIAASVHQESHQETIVDFVFAQREKLQALPTALISVSLSAAIKQGREDADRYVERFTTITKWKPTRTLLLAGAIRFSKYDYFKQQIVKHIVMSGGVSTPSGEDFEFTDWKALTEFLDEFLQVAIKAALAT